MLWGQPADPSLKSVPPAVPFDMRSGRAMDQYRDRPLNLQRLLVGMHLRTTGVPGQGVDCRLLCLVINLPGPALPPGGFSRSSCGCGITSWIMQTHELFERRTVQPAKTRNLELSRCRQGIPGILARPHRALQGITGTRGGVPGFCVVYPNDNHPFTMTVNPAVRSTKNFTPQVPLYL